MRSVFVIFFLGTLYAGSVLAERADRDKPVHLESDRAFFFFGWIIARTLLSELVLVFAPLFTRKNSVVAS